jgi:hypothetical protein
MAGRSLRNKRVLVDSNEQNNADVDLSDAQPWCDSETTEHAAEDEQLLDQDVDSEVEIKNQDLAGGEKTSSTNSGSSTNKGINAGDARTQPDLLSIIWKALQEDREKYERIRNEEKLERQKIWEEDEKIRRADKLEREEIRKQDEEKFERMVEKLANKFSADIENRLYGATTQKTAIFILTAVRTSNPT